MMLIILPWEQTNLPGFFYSSRRQDVFKLVEQNWVAIDERSSLLLLHPSKAISWGQIEKKKKTGKKQESWISRRSEVTVDYYSLEAGVIISSISIVKLS